MAPDDSPTVRWIPGVNWVRLHIIFQAYKEQTSSKKTNFKTLHFTNKSEKVIVFQHRFFQSPRFNNTKKQRQYIFQGWYFEWMPHYFCILSVPTTSGQQKINSTTKQDQIPLSNPKQNKIIREKIQD